MTWVLVIRLLLIGLLLRRLAADAVHVRRGAIPATRLAAPAVAIIAAALVLNHLLSRSAVIAALLALDIAILALCVGIVASVSRRTANFPLTAHLEQSLAKFFPPWFARLAITDIVILSHACAGMRAFVNPGRSGMHTYIHGSKIMMCAVIMAASIVPDAALFWLLIPHKYWWSALLLDVLDVWACLWLFGIYGTMAQQPHELSAEKIVLRNGFWEKVEFHPSIVESATVLGVVKRRKLRIPRNGRTAFLSFGGVPLVEVKLQTPALSSRHFSKARREVGRIFVASDAAEALCAALTAFHADHIDVDPAAAVLSEP